MGKKLFFCDISGTFTSDSKERFQQLKNLQEALMLLAEDSNITFSFITSDEESFLNSYIEEWLPYTNNSIIMGKQFFRNGYIENGNVFYTKKMCKFEQILSYAYSIECNNKIDSIYFADDSNINHEILSVFNNKYKIIHITKDKNPTLVYNYYSNKFGIEGLTECINEIYKDNHINEKKCKH